MVYRYYVSFVTGFALSSERNFLCREYSTEFWISNGRTGSINEDRSGRDYRVEFHVARNYQDHLRRECGDNRVRVQFFIRPGGIKETLKETWSRE